MKCSKFIRADVAFISSDSAHSVWCNFSLPKHKQLTDYNLNAESPSGLCANSELQTKKNTHILFSVFVPRVELTHLSAARAPNCKKGTFHSISLTVLHARSLVSILLLDRAIVDSQKKKNGKFRATRAWGRVFHWHSNSLMAKITPEILFPRVTIFHINKINLRSSAVN